MRRRRDLAFSIGFLTPSLVPYCLFVIYAIVLAFYYTLTDWKGLGDKHFIWFENYRNLLFDKEYWQVTRNSFTIVILAILIQNPVGILLAFFISRLSKGYRFYRAAIFLPVVIPAATTGLMFALLLNNDLDIMNGLLRAIGLGFLQQNWLTNSKIVIYSVALPQVWQYLGILFVIYLAAIQSIPKEIMESALIDGASSLRTLRSIILPQLRDIIVICVILNVAGALKAFDMSWIMTWGGPGISSAYISVLMFRHAVKGFNFAYGITIAMTILIYSAVFTVVFRRLFLRKHEG